jgi:hypothetical protein
MGAIYRPLMRELPDRPEPRYKWTEIVFLAFCLVLVFWVTRLQDDIGFLSMFWAGFFLSVFIPEPLCRKFQRERKPQKSLGSIFGESKSATVISWILFVGIMIFVLGPWQDSVFGRIPLWLQSLIWVVFIPVFRVATYIEKRVWLRWAWASAASVIALALLYL